MGKRGALIIQTFWPAVCLCYFLFRPNPGTNLKALYTGRYQQTKEHGVKRMAQRMARPRPTPLDEGSIQNIAREEIRFRSIVPVLTETDKSEDWCYRTKYCSGGDCKTISASVILAVKCQCLHRR